jgi:hypothetical protein
LRCSAAAGASSLAKTLPRAAEVLRVSVRSDPGAKKELNEREFFFFRSIGGMTDEIEFRSLLTVSSA